MSVRGGLPPLICFQIQQSLNYPGGSCASFIGNFLFNIFVHLDVRQDTGNLNISKFGALMNMLNLILRQKRKILVKKITFVRWFNPILKEVMCQTA